MQVRGWIVTHPGPELNLRLDPRPGFEGAIGGQDDVVGEDKGGIWYRIQPAALLASEPEILALRSWFLYSREITFDDYQTRPARQLQAMAAMLATYERWKVRRRGDT